MHQRGFSMIEILVVLAIMAVLLGIGLPSFQTMTASTKTKSVAESILSGLRNTRSEAIKRNAPMRFQMVSSLDATCALSATSQLWVITQTNQGMGGYTYGLPTGQCHAAATQPPDYCTSAACSDQPFIAYKSPGNTDSTVSVVGSNSLGGVASTVTFGPLGQILANVDASASLAQVDVASSVNGAKAWRVRITPSSGSLKFCDPSAAAAGTPLGC